METIQAAPNGVSNGIPSGSILMWSGDIDNIPNGWHLCDGTNGTPDLRNRFIVGAGSNYDVGNTGGFDSVALTVGQMPSHSHSGGSASISLPSGHLTDPWSVGGNAFDYTYVTEISYQNMPCAITVGSAGLGQNHENRPPYYALCFIMKL